VQRGGLTDRDEEHTAMHSPRLHRILAALAPALALAGCGDPSQNPFDSGSASSTTTRGSSDETPPADTTRGSSSSSGAVDDSGDGPKLDVGPQDLPGGNYE
jgi:hypothetical protein